MAALTATAAMAALDAHADPGYAASMHWFFQAHPGGYGEGDQFRGLKVPVVRQVCKAFRGMPIGELELLLASPWHEHRLAAAILMATEYPRGDAARRAALYALLLRNTHRLNNWDLVDQTAPYVVGPHLDVVGVAVLDELAASALLWDRRIAMVSTFFRIRRGEADDALHVAELLLADPHPLIHKVVGWMLREVGKRVDEALLLAFLDEHAATMPAVMRSYATERLAPEIRARYQRQPRRRGG